MNGYNNYIRSFSKLSAVWLFVAVWWGFILFSPLQYHNEIIRTDLMFLLTGFLFLIILGFYKKQEPPYFKKNILLILPVTLLLIPFYISIFYLKDVTLSFFLIITALLMLAYSIGFSPFIKISWMLFLSTLALAITNIVMNSLRGSPAACANFFSPQISFLLNIFGGKTASVSGTIFFKGKRITCDLIKLGFYPWLAFTLSFCILIISSKGRKGIIPVIVSFFLHYLFLLFRFSWLVLKIPSSMFAGPPTFNLLYWRFPLYSFAPLIPLWFLIILNINLTDFPYPPKIEAVHIKKIDVPICILLFLVAVSFTLYYTFPGFLTHQKINIIIDEIHSQWESTIVDFNKEITGILAENSYHSFLDYLRHFHQINILTEKSLDDTKSIPEGVKIIHEERITRKFFDEIQRQSPESKTVLILKCITKPFSEDEIEAIKDFVFRGGCAFLIGDHTDVFFINKNLNELSTSFGIRYKQNSIYFIDGGWVITEPKDYRLHPVTSYLDKFIWATGDSIETKTPAFPLIYSSIVCFADEVNYFYENFFGNTRIDAEEIFGSFCIMAGAEYGKGKVAAFTDSTCFNNYLMFTVGRRELIAGINRWFGSMKSYNLFLWLTLLLAVSLSILILKLGKEKPSYYLFLLFILSGCIVGFILSKSFKNSVYTPPQSLIPLPDKVLIDAAHEPAHCLSYGNSESFISDTSYDNLIFNIGRINLFPNIVYTGEMTKDILGTTGSLIIGCPRKEYIKEEKQDIYDFVINGGSLLLIEGANPDSTINQVANMFDINFRLDLSREKIYQIKKNLSGAVNDLPINPAWVDGGEVLFSSDGLPIISYLKKGKGLIVILGDDSLFMKRNPSPYLTMFQCNLMECLIKKDIKGLKSINWNYLEWEYGEG